MISLSYSQLQNIIINHYHSYGYHLDIVIIILLPVWFDVGAAEHFNFIIPVLKVLHSTATQQRKSFGFSCRFQTELT